MSPPNFNNDLEKWNWLKEAPHSDVKSRQIIIIARGLKQASFGSDTLYAHLALAIARDGIKYQIDTERVGREDLGHPINALFRGVDDCDAKSRLFVALCLAVNIPAHMEGVWNNGRLQHVYGRVYLNSKWYSAETTLSRARLGDNPMDVPREKSGKLLTT
jgi:transglutaminase-like putative cysteine protease